MSYAVLYYNLYTQPKKVPRKELDLLDVFSFVKSFKLPFRSIRRALQVAACDPALSKATELQKEAEKELENFKNYNWATMLRASGASWFRGLVGLGWSIGWLVVLGCCRYF